MQVDLRAKARQLLIRAGTRLSTERLHDASTVMGALALGRWLAEHPPGPEGLRVHTDKTDTYRDAVALLTAPSPLYLEFGVWEGWSLRWWIEHLSTPGARFVGFDSFEGLPEQWRPDYPPGTFDVAGAPPAITDPRVSFEVGWFNETLAKFEMPAHDQLFVNIDCTLYTSTAVVLEWLEPHLKPGDLIYFDELPEYDHELRAFFEHDERTKLNLVPVSQARGYYWLFQYTN
jgi:methyltransferase family protein